MLCEHRLDSRAAETFRRINEAWADGTVARTAVFDRFNEFRTGNGDLTHKRGAGRPLGIHRQTVSNATERSLLLTIHIVADDLKRHRVLPPRNPEKKAEKWAKVIRVVGEELV
ncbi:hypothetical protein KIN20_022460 [Parelaphostrongylus tenuis]|uniref:Mos1 transposase HTH domain-containing protein n=1 Tax=Parelaphostrongylus tenuis TaxID=148309 RepID=A0AAD5QV70_PARTN|nr:hypothetical protein KIN20_002643 [Parelaphostrongylus tenuis]KAJ1353236.1 hypothetical protein KIN20_009830 [Parelaphostrongylus tenuis]KAJ1354976.1 hypothetical protein KIN20_012083 [Parelaphostrongylus tenuis]KAJ1362784.1 hypothetical protein KIN20_022460 [Parelaphostrongylus tenuis]